MPGSDHNMPSVSLSNYIIEPEALKLIPESIARKYTMVPIFKIRETLTVAIPNTSDIVALDEARLASGCDIQAIRADESEIIMVIEQNYNISDSIEEIVKGLEGMKVDFLSGKKIDAQRMEKIVGEPPIIRLVNLIIFQALKDRASDIHIEPEEKNIQVRFRIDGILHNVLTFSLEMLMPIVCRIKVISKLNIVESRLPQDGHFSMSIGERNIDLRVSTFPITFGEKVVMRVLDRSTTLLSLDKLGFSPEVLEKFEVMIQKPYGIILVTGPTGSGKSSTLYASLGSIKSQDRNIVTLEDPREYIFEGINQAEVNPAIGFTFANGLRSILRQDPDIILVGEVRDAETAEISIRAALTGHLVLTSLHTNDASGAVTRLINMGIEPFLIASSLIGVLAQRLVRVICPNCKEEYAASEEVYKRLGLSKDKSIHLYRGKGCVQCRNSGYKGRIGIFEAMVLDDNLRELIISNKPASAIKEAAKTAGMSLLEDDGFDKVLKGITTIEEVLRVAFIDE
ncbi:MAG: GspE/PulE family protein [Candidatus Omnitrophota bacterium]|nr:GspE/PulE family protein [Candidatus Omnitrophota bacterium]MBU1928282.1 GspE/PulE family protein [Candidatus Omnitrophota bacterium]MBU2035562.1 GspE/PulE family protein [Candidatus Omnitrophota bacterium]MBU2221795.1 GspE/PulE family protein [Candidatus Omnitrophota bacterium]